MHFSHLKYICIIGCIDKCHLLQYLYSGHSLRHQLCLHFPAAIEIWYILRILIKSSELNVMVDQIIQRTWVLFFSLCWVIQTMGMVFTQGKLFVSVYLFLLTKKKSNLKTQWAPLTVTFFSHCDWFYLLISVITFYSISTVSVDILLLLYSI